MICTALPQYEVSVIRIGVGVGVGVRMCVYSVRNTSPTLDRCKLQIVLAETGIFRILPAYMNLPGRGQ